MKTNTSLLFAVLLCSVFLLSSCMQSTSIRVLQPADIVLPEHIQEVATIDRSKPANGFLKVLEGLFTGESIGQDKRGRVRALDGLTHSLTRTPRFRVRPTDIELEGTNTGNRMAPPLSWEEIDRICELNKTDAVVAIEQFNIDHRTFTETYTEKYKDKDGKQQQRTMFRAQTDLGVTVGWRLYDPKLRVIHDEQALRAGESYRATGNTDRQARRSLPNMVQASFDVAYEAGMLYGMRIAPTWVQVQRSFYHKGKKPHKETMKHAARLARTGNWEEAGKVWYELEPLADQKTAGRAAYNLALAAEQNGQLELALEWAERAYAQHGNKQARDYTFVLQQRINDARRVDYQMHKKPAT